MPIPTPVRLKEIDFLRGLAVLLVIFRHFRLIQPLQEMGWIGVDLFFVLSGFLVSGLLFKEYQQTGKINGFRFLIRRGFKIYPVFYAFILFTILYKVTLNKPIPLNALAGELFFLQNYLGSFWNHTWSLAVEEHFYFILTFLLWITSRTGLTGNRKFFTGITLFIAITCLAQRVYFNTNELKIEYLYYSHFRFDSLFWGVFLSFQYHFNKENLQQFVIRYKHLLRLIFIASISFTPFIDERSSYFVRTIGFSLLYFGFGSLLLQFIFLRYDILLKKTKISALLYNILSTIGFYSYSVYIIHIMIALIATQLQAKFMLDNTLTFLFYLLASVGSGMIISRTIEIPFLKLREKYFPKTETTPTLTT